MEILTKKGNNNTRSYAKRLTAAAATVGMMVSMASPAWAATWNIADGDIKITAKEDGQYVYQEGKTGADGHLETDETIITGTSTKNTVTIEAEKDQTADVTLDDLKIDVSSKIEAAITIKGEGDVNLELDGENKVESGRNHAGIEKNNSASTGTLTIDDADEDGGSLKATGGYWGAGIGGGDGQSASQIVIDGGTIEAEGSYGGAGIGGGYGGAGEVTINDGEVTANGGTSGAGIGGGWLGAGTVTVDGGTVTATSGEPDEEEDSPDAIGAGGYVSGTSKPQSEATYNDGTIVEQEKGSITENHKTHNYGSGTLDGCKTTYICVDCGTTKTEYAHSWDSGVVLTPATYETEGEMTYTCTECGYEKTVTIPKLVQEENSVEELPLTVNNAQGTAIAYEQTLENGRAVFAAPAQDAILTGSLGALAELKAQGATTLVFRTKLCETSVSIDKLLAAGSEDDVFVLTHKGTQAVLTVAGRIIK